MKVGMQLRMSATQQLALTPQLQQSIKLLQLSTLELEQEIEKNLLENPLLERVDQHEDETNSEYSDPHLQTEKHHDNDDNDSHSSEKTVLEEFETPSFDQELYANQDISYDDFSSSSSNNEIYDALSQYASHQNYNDDEEIDIFNQYVSEKTLHEFLNEQIRLLSVDEHTKRLIYLLTDYLNDDGYLIQDLQEIAIDHTNQHDVIDPQELAIALRYIQNLEPNGIGARDLAECIQIQLKQMAPQTELVRIALEIVNNYLQYLANKDYAKLKKLLQVDFETIKQAHQLIKQTNPKPASQFSQSHNFYIVPDVIVQKNVKSLEWEVSLNPDAMPKLRVNQMYASILQQSRHKNAQNDSTAIQGLQTQLQEAKWFIRNIYQRFETILKVSQAIINTQSDFLEHGEEAMKSLVLREIAEEVGLHESTISRVTTQKYMMTPRGIYELKYFFGSSVSTDDGGSRSSTSIKAMIKKLISEENLKKPLSDSQISEILAKQGIIVARRTVAKYRESLNILPVSQRKSLY